MGKLCKTSDHLILPPCIFWSLSPVGKCLFDHVGVYCLFSFHAASLPSSFCAPLDWALAPVPEVCAVSSPCGPSTDAQQGIGRGCCLRAPGGGLRLTEEWGRSPRGCWLCPSSLMVFTGPRYEAGGRRAFLPRRERSVIGNADGGE